ncbi:allene oxide synthase-lipoxygenase protein-like isoform X7 [Dreissena polymorpha]|uniref:allene oxide synthase-lipoxygenase protein-like isoform X7 n=1 Tax=Dreissena polymorpha TaxID=45954 RepID=UPI00226483B6|nr:allene oxide synthase-lipoxygenase protein-like isoform X7 [Dreissena polymorpha]
MADRVDYEFHVRTGDRKFAGTDANVWVILHGEEGISTEEMRLSNMFKDDFEQGQLDKFLVKKQAVLTNIVKLELWRDNFGFGSQWYVDYIKVKRKDFNNEVTFPIFRWIPAKTHLMFRVNDTMLPQDDPEVSQRWEELRSKRESYLMCQKVPDGPSQIKNMPADEAFSFDYKWDIVKRKLQLIATSKIVMFTAGRWESIQHLRNVYTKEVFCEPHGCTRWSNDLCFAGQRVASMNHSCIELCTKIPDKFGVTEELLKPYLEGQSLQKILDSKRMFIVDHTILAGLPCRKGFHSCVPMALFYVNNNKQLIPVAIQLNQDKGTDNPVFFPNDPPNVWMKAKMWFNNADANVHQSLTHLGFTHLLMEGVTVVTHRNLSQSHPVFKLLSPHFLYLIAINSRGLELLVSKNGWVDKTMNIGQEGMFALIARGIKKWRMNVEGTLPEDLKQRGVLDTNVLPGYHFRNDALLLYGAINKYVKKYVDLYYDSVDKITGDWEIQSWGAELTKEREKGGCGLEGVPSHGKFSSKEDLYLTLTSIIYTCSVAHASTNFPQYDEYAYPPNYPALLNGEPPKDKRPVEETELVSMLPDKPTTLDMMTVTKILSSRGTNSLGDFEVQYIFEPEACKVVDEFRADLAEISKVIKQRNKERNPPYPYLDPDIVPNSISI